MRRFAKSLLYVLKVLLWMLLVRVIQKNPKKIVFGAWRGENFSDNPKYFMLECLRCGEFDCIWIGKKHLREDVEAIKGARFVEKGRFGSLWSLLTAKYYVCNIFPHDDITGLPTFGRTVLINFCHGTPFKRFGMRQLRGNGLSIGELICDNPTTKGPRRWIREFLARATDEKCWVGASSGDMREVLVESWPQMFAKERVLDVGTPRIDFLIQNKDNLSYKVMLKKKYAKVFKVDTEKKWYLYLPTWRNNADCPFTFSTMNMLAQLEKILRTQDAIIIEKQHPSAMMKIRELHDSSDFVHVITKEEAKYIDVQELLLASDRMISDYSSCFYDFELLNRPVIHYAFDLQDYATKDSGVMYDLNEVAAGPVVKTERELIDALAASDKILLSKKGFNCACPIEYEKGNACKSFVALIHNLNSEMCKQSTK